MSDKEEKIFEKPVKPKRKLTENSSQPSLQEGKKPVKRNKRN